jgi:glycosyltransferase involved in cell wall biosynthesis
MRIAHVTDCYLPRLGGIEMHVHDLANRQHAAGHEITVITSTPAHLSDDREVSPRIVDNVSVRRIRSGVRPPAWRAARAAAAAYSLFRPGDYDIVHAHSSMVSPMAVSAARAASMQGIPTVLTLHSLINGFVPLTRLTVIALSARDWPLLWSGVSEAAAAPLRRGLGRDCQVAILPNGVDPEQWRTAAALRDPNTVVITSVMRLERRKRPLPLLRMLRRLREVVPSTIDLRVAIIGEGSMRSRMEQYLATNGMADWVRLPGRLERDHIRDIYTRSDLYVAPATLESFGIAALEARCAGVPVIGFRKGGVGEFIGHGHEGLLASSDNQMVEVMRKFCVDDTLRGRIAAHNRASLPSVNWPSVLRVTEAAYHEAAQLVASPAALASGAAATIRR